MKPGETVYWKGPGQWRSYCERVQPCLTQEQLHDISRDEIQDKSALAN